MGLITPNENQIAMVRSIQPYDKSMSDLKMTS